MPTARSWADVCREQIVSLEAELPIARGSRVAYLRRRIAYWRKQAKNRPAATSTSEPRARRPGPSHWLLGTARSA